MKRNGYASGCVIEASQKRHLVGDEHHFADDQRRRSRDEEPAKLYQVIRQDQPLGEQDQVETDKEEDRRRNDLAKFLRSLASIRRANPVAQRTSETLKP